ncbi:HTH domain-containing protein [Weissella confusa]|uniref:HTH domain-containing protein n=1 Tax=Weissella confusa TaxID=1583 RepID=UPI00189FCD2C|nr:HTH domain-containing protein [Weissella confusa]MBF7059246.1 HTH domain-containing protein [Weissella confusa]
MSENLKTIRELADELGVSKQAIWQKIKRDTSIDLRQFTSTKGNTVYVNVDGQKAIKSMFPKDSSTKYRQHKDDIDDNEKDNVDNQEEVKFLRNLVSEIQSEKKELHKLLDQQQRLALQDKQLIEEYKAEIKDLKALAMPSHTVEKYASPQSETEPAEAQAKPKKWWQFKKRGQKND